MKKIALLIAATMMASTTPAVAETSAMDLVTQVHEQVNFEIRYTPDKKRGFDLYDSWNLPVDNRGDCEDIALLKKKRLIEAGFDPNDIQLLIVARESDDEMSKRKSNKTTRVVYLHVVNYIPSLGVILDNSALRSNLTGNQKKRIPIVSYANWMKANQAELFCVVKDETFSDKIDIRDRCQEVVLARK